MTILKNLIDISFYIVSSKFRSKNSTEPPIIHNSLVMLKKLKRDWLFTLAAGS